MFGPRDTHFIAQLVKQAANGSITHMVGEGLNVTDFTYVENAVYAFALATEGLQRNSKIGGKCYFITNGRPVFFWTFILRLLDACGCPRPTKKMSWSVAWFLACLMEFFALGLWLDLELVSTRDPLHGGYNEPTCMVQSRESFPGPSLP